MSSLRWERTWDQILGNGVVDHGMPPRPCGTRGILGSHPLAAATRGCGRADGAPRRLGFLTIMTAHDVDCGEGRANKGQEAGN